jgi:lipid-A-disaccharide synthase
MSALSRPQGPSPRANLAWALAQTLAQGALLPARLLGDAWARERRLADFERLWTAPAAPLDPEPALLGPPRPLTLFISCAEASGEHHGLYLLQAIEARLREAGWPPPRWFGLGGPRLSAAGVALVGDPVARAAMGFGVAKALPFYLRLLETAAATLRQERVDLCIGVDSPALNGPLAGMAKRCGVRTLQFVAPQHWAWAPWRSGAWGRRVDLTLTLLPFEPAWFAARGVRTRHVGHPILDELPPRRPVATAPRLVLLPGSRRSVIARHLPVQLALAAAHRARQPETEVCVVQGRSELGPQIEAILAAEGASGWARLALGNLHEHLAGARAAISVSGTVLLDLLHQRIPALVIYRVESAFEEWLGRRALSVPCFGITNLLAGRKVLPEFGFRGAAPLEDLGRALEGLWEPGPAREAALAGLELAAERLGPPGANRRAAAWALCLAAGEKLPERDEAGAPGAVGGRTR